MPTFSTPDPISVTVDIEIGAVRIVASDRDDTVVDVRPSDPSHPVDVRAAEHTQTDFTSGRLQVRTPKQRNLGLFGKPGSVDVTIELPTGSQLHGTATMASFRASGCLGECRLKTLGDIELERTGPVELRTGQGAISVDVVAGHADVRTGSGEIRLGSVQGAVLVKNANGSTWIGDVSGDARVKAANGDISVWRAGGDVVATSANGDLRLAEVARGSASLRTAAGEIEIGICDGSAARMDVHTSFGRVRNLLSRVDSPAGCPDTLEVHARTSAGDIIIRRA